MYFDDLLTDYVGEFGRYQIFLYLLLAAIEIPSAYNTMGIVFVAGVPEHWCDVPAINNITVRVYSIPYVCKVINEAKLHQFII